MIHLISAYCNHPDNVAKEYPNAVGHTTYSTSIGGIYGAVLFNEGDRPKSGYGTPFNDVVMADRLLDVIKWSESGRLVLYSDKWVQHIPAGASAADVEKYTASDPQEWKRALAHKKVAK